MKCSLAIFVFVSLFLNLCKAQAKFGVIFPNQFKKSSFYFSPNIDFGVSPSVLGVIKVGEVFDSVQSLKAREYLFQIEYNNVVSDSVRKGYLNQHGLKIIVDTVQEICQDQQFYESYEIDSINASPKYLKVIGKNSTRKILLKDAKTLPLAAMPVYIVNTTDEGKKIYDQDFHINLVQEILDPKGNWREIEIYETGFCGMAWGWRKLPPNSMIITSILKYGGNYKTIGRVKFSNGTVYYSNTYSINVNPAIFLSKTMKIGEYSIIK